MHDRSSPPRDIALIQDERGSLLREGLYKALAAAASEGAQGNGRILDVGCGRGEVMRALGQAGFRMIGLDSEAACVAASAAYGEVHQGSVGDVEETFKGVGFEAVICSHLLEHLPDPHRALRAMRSLDARRYVFAVPNILRPARLIRALFRRRRGDHPHHLFGWGHAEFERLLRDCGFQVVAWHADRVTIVPFGGRTGTLLTRWLRPFEERGLARLFPMLSSSLIVSCVQDGVAPPGGPGDG